MKYLCLAYEEEALLAAQSGEEWAALRRETLDYVETLRESGVLLDTRPLQSATTATMVSVRAGRTVLTDGPFAETKEQIGGYFLIELDNLDAALRVAAGWPSARLGHIEVRPVEERLRDDKRY